QVLNGSVMTSHAQNTANQRSVEFVNRADIRPFSATTASDMNMTTGIRYNPDPIFSARSSGTRLNTRKMYAVTQKIPSFCSPLRESALYTAAGGAAGEAYSTYSE